MMTIEGFTWVIKSLMEVPSILIRLADILALFSKVFIPAMVVIGVGYHITSARKRRWTILKMVTDSIMTVYMAVLGSILLYFVIRVDKTLCYIRGNASMLLEEVGEEILQISDIQKLSLFCFSGVVVAGLSFLVAVFSGKAAYKKLCLLRKVMPEEVTVQMVTDVPKGVDEAVTSDTE